MGLEEKRAIKKFQDEQYPELKTQIDTAADFNVSVEVKWDKIMEDGYSHLYNEAFTKVYFTPLINAFKEITVDEMGKDALKEVLKKVVITNEKGNSSLKSNLKLENGELIIDHKPTTNMDDISDRTKAIATTIMSNM